MGVIKLKKAGQEEVVGQVGEIVEIVDENALVAETVAQDIGAENAMWDDPAVLGEDESKITENSRHYVLNNGTAKSVFTASAMNFYDEDEKKWKTIDNSLEEREDCYEAKFGKFKAQIAKAEHKKAVKISGNGLSVSWEYLGKKNQAAAVNLSAEQTEKTAKPVALAVKKSVKGIAGIAKDGEAVYENIEDNTNLQYILQGNNVKENIIVKEKSDEYKYLFALNTEGLTMRLSEDSKSIELCSETVNTEGVKEEKVEFTIPSPYMYDSEGNQSEDVYYEIEEESDGRYVFAVVADSAWINEFNRAFPVTIDPQIVTNSSDILSWHIERRYFSSSGNSNSWSCFNSEIMHVKRSSGYEERIAFSVDRDKLGLKNKKIVSAKLTITVSSGSGNFYINNNLYYASAGKSFTQDITKNFNGFTNSSSIYVAPYGNSYLLIEFYTKGYFTPKLEVEFLNNENSQVVKKTFDLAGATGHLNLAWGELGTKFCDMETKNSVLGLDICHVYKKSSDDYLLGKNFRLNFNERLIKNAGEKTNTDYNVSYFYTDSNGDKRGFREYYYYIDTLNQKVYVQQTSCTINSDGVLKYNNYTVYPEYRSTTGLKIIHTYDSEYDLFKKIKLFEGRGDEEKQLQEQVDSYENAWKDFVILNLNNGTYSNECISEDRIMGSYWDYEMPIPKSEAFQYYSLKKQFIYLQNSIDNISISGVKTIEAQLRNYLDKGLATDNSVKTTIEEIYRKFDAGNVISNLTYESLKSSTELFSGKSGGCITQIEFYEMFRQRNEMLEQIQMQTTEMDSQKETLVEQISLIKDKRELYIKQLLKYYKEYVNKLYELEQMKKQTPVNFLLDGNIIKGFNENGDLVVVYDQFENYAVVEYESYHISDNLFGDRIKQIYDNNGKTVRFSYRVADGLLDCIIDSCGRKTEYDYADGKLTEIKRFDGKAYKISYTTDSYNNIAAVENETDKLKATLGYSGNKLISITQYSTVVGISMYNITDGSRQISTINIDYSDDNINDLITHVQINYEQSKERFSFDTDCNLKSYYREENGAVVEAEQYEYVPYWKDQIKQSNPCKVIKKAKKSSLYVTPLSSYIFSVGDTETTILNQFELAERTTISAVDLNESGSVKRTEVVDYNYDDSQKIILEKSTVTETGRTPIVFCKKYYYNAAGSVVRKESYIEGEELTSGINIEETEFDEKGHAIRSFTYNSLDSSSKFYTESEYAENGKTLAEYDETGEHRTEFEYVGDTEIVRTQKLPNGGKFSYGYDVDDTVTSITQSTDEGEENSTHTRYTCGEVTELVSGNNKVQYAYDHKRRLSSVNLNGVANYVAYTYGDKIIATVNGTSKTVDKVTATYVKRDEKTNADVFETLSDLNGNTVQTKYNGTVQAEWAYSADNRLTAYSDKINNRTAAYTYDTLDRVKTYTEKSGSTELVKETYGYDDYGSLLSKTITGQVSHTYTYSYKQDAAHTLESIACGTIKVKPNTDVNDRNIGKELYVSNVKKAEEIVTYRKVGDHATNMPSAVWFGNVVNGNYVIRDNVKYAYDEMGNIGKIYENGEMTVRYAYDKLSRLVREDNKAFGKTWVYAYDHCGNIISKREFDYTLRDTDKLEELASVDKLYSYDGDRLMGYGSETFVYDNMGNPTTYRGKSASWSKGRQLQSFNGTAFTYDSQGRRLSKGNITFTYDSDGRIIKQSNGLEFIYDGAGVVGVNYNGKTCLYRKDAQGNIVALLDSDGNVVVKYVYDAWGNHGIEVVNSDYATLANLNPFRYRGYYYDTETALYFLQTRYYDPEVGRFITIDGIEYIDPETINGLNLYAYCGNNPVMRTDSAGTSFLLTLIIGAIIAGAIAGTIKTVTTAVQGGSVLDCLGAFVGGFITGAVLGAASILGGGLAVGAFAVTTASIIGTVAFLTVGTFTGGMFSYYAENKIKGNEISVNDMLINGALTFTQGLFSFGIGVAMGAAGLYNSLKPGHGFMDAIKITSQIIKMEMGHSIGKTLFYGTMAFLGENLFPMIIRTFMKSIFTSPWNLIKP